MGEPNGRCVGTSRLLPLFAAIAVAMPSQGQMTDAEEVELGRAALQNRVETGQVELVKNHRLSDRLNRVGKKIANMA